MSVGLVVALLASGRGPGIATTSSFATNAAPEIPAGSSSPSGAAGKGASRQNVAGVTSLNWAGYVDTGLTFSSVAGSWVQPAASCPDKKQQAAFWVGLGGYVQGDPDIEQVGTDSDCVKTTKRNPGGPSYYAWYQMYPQDLVVLPTSSYPVSPGQTIQASVTLSGSDRYTLSIVDVGHWTYSTVQSQASQPTDASAEWITEAPQTCNARGTCKILSLSDFGSVDYSGASANGAAVSASGRTDTMVTMTTKGARKVKAAPSGLTGSGTAFSVTWVS